MSRRKDGYAHDDRQLAFPFEQLAVLLKYLSDHHTMPFTIPPSDLCSLNTHRADLPPIDHIISYHATTRPFPTSRPDRKLLPNDTDSDLD